MEAKYSFNIYWPDRTDNENFLKLYIKPKRDLCPTDPSELYSQRFKRWTLGELELIEEGLGVMENTLGYSAVLQITSGEGEGIGLKGRGVLYRVNKFGNRAEAVFCTSFCNFNSDSLTESQNRGKTETAHEVRHNLVV